MNRNKKPWQPESFVRVLAGSVILVSAALVFFHSVWWLLLTCFVGINLIQSAFTGFCPPTIIGRRLGWFAEGESCCNGRGTAEEAP
ncbi:MAG: DUF2892 domain-containing protein [Opitutales bacterium]|nr:DUF2892 domain-containing protein [Opitutales bacterium]